MGTSAESFRCTWITKKKRKDFTSKDKINKLIKFKKQIKLEEVVPTSNPTQQPLELLDFKEI